LFNKILKKFYTTKKYRGSGLGLGIVKGVVEAHQADISFYSEETKTQFQITFSCV
jgi:Signal transduction histidine kinase